jgi:hypothetical protein
MRPRGHSNRDRYKFQIPATASSGQPVAGLPRVPRKFFEIFTHKKLDFPCGHDHGPCDCDWPLWSYQYSIIVFCVLDFLSPHPPSLGVSAACQQGVRFSPPSGTPGLGPARSSLGRSTSPGASHDFFCTVCGPVCGPVGIRRFRRPIAFVRHSLSHPDPSLPRIQISIFPLSQSVPPPSTLSWASRFPVPSNSLTHWPGEAVGFHLPSFDVKISNRARCV